MVKDLNNSYNLTKDDIAFYLLHYAQIIRTAYDNPDIDFGYINHSLIKRLYNSEIPTGLTYYNSMHIFQFFLLKRIFSYGYDSKFSNIKEDMLEKIELPDNIFVNSSDKNKFSKKQIIRYIRDGLNHNDSKDTYSFVYENDVLLIDIHVPWAKPIPFHIRIKLADFLQLEKLIVDSEYNPSLSMILTKDGIDFSNKNIIEELNKVFLRKYNFDKNKTINLLELLIEKARENSKMNTKIFDKIEGTSYKDYFLSLSQRLRAEVVLSYLINVKGIKPSMKLYNYAISDLMRFGNVKIPYLKIDYFISYCYVDNPDRSLNDFKKDVDDYISHKKKKDTPLAAIRDLYKSDYLLYRAYLFEDLVISAYNIFLSYIFDTYLTDDYVDIAGKHIEREKIRNSFVHGNFYVGNHEKYKLFDTKKGKNHEDDVNWSETISLDNLLDFCLKRINYPEKKPKIDMPITVSIKGDFISFIKDDITYFYLLKLSNANKKNGLMINTLYKIEGSKLYKIEDIDEFKLFFEQIKKMSDTELIKIKDVVRNILESTKNYDFTDKSRNNNSR